MGRNRTPTNVLELRGALTGKKRTERAQEPAPNGDVGSPPKHLTKAQRAAWTEIKRNSPPGVFAKSDPISLEMAAVLVAELREDPKEMITSRMARLDSLLSRFGMTPADRSRVTVDKEDEPDGWDSL